MGQLTLGQYKSPVQNGGDIQGVNFFLVHFSWHSFTYGLYVNTIALFLCVLLGRKGRGVAACMIVFSVLFLYYSITNAVLSWTLFCFTSILFTLHEIVPSLHNKCWNTKFHKFVTGMRDGVATESNVTYIRHISL